MIARFLFLAEMQMPGIARPFRTGWVMPVWNQSYAHAQLANFFLLPESTVRGRLFRVVVVVRPHVAAKK
jgi:hypothetical protein